MSDEKTTAPAEDAEDKAEDETEAPKDGGRANRTRVTVDVERAAAERETAQALSRASGPRVQVTRNEMVYRADATWSGRDDRGQRVSLLSDGWRARNGDMPGVHSDPYSPWARL